MRAAKRALCFRAAPGCKLRVLVAFVLWAAFSAGAARARAAPMTFVTLEYDVAGGGSGCPDEQEFRARVDRQLGYDPFRDTADRRVSVQITRTDAGFEGFIRWSDARGRWVGDRRLSSRRPECSDITASVVFAIAVQIQLLASLEPEAPKPGAPSTAPARSETNKESETQAPTPSATSPTRSQETRNPSTQPNRAGTSPEVSRPPAARADRLRMSAGLGAALALGVAPEPAWLGRIFVSGGLEPFSVELAVDAALPVTHRERDGSGFSLNRLAADAAACGHLQAFAACLTATLGRIEARGEHLDKPETPAGLFSQLGGRIAVRQAFSDRYFVGARLEALVMLSSWAVTLNDTVVWKTPRVGGLIGLDLGTNFF